MREKYVVRNSEGEPLLGIRYDDAVAEGEVLVGGPMKNIDVAEMIVEVITGGNRNIEECQFTRSGNRMRLFIEEVTKEEWRKLLYELQKYYGFSLQPTRCFRRMMQ